MDCKYHNGLNKIKFVGTFRNPLMVAKSLNKAWNIPIMKCIELWYIYNIKMISKYKISEFPILRFDVQPDEYLGDLGYF